MTKHKWQGEEEDGCYYRIFDANGNEIELGDVSIGEKINYYVNMMRNERR